MTRTDDHYLGFASTRAGTVPLRVRRPEGSGLPVLVFLHGGAEAGTDNRVQLTGTLGAVELARRYPDHIVIAPQAAPSTIPLMPARAPFAERVLDPDSGWNRETLQSVAGYVSSLIDEGAADAACIRLTGVSMGGAGTLRMLDVAPDLFSGAAPVCPTMTPETLGILHGIRTPIWISTAYVDHTPDRHAYIVDGVLALLRAGAADVHLSIFTPEQLATVGIPSAPGLTTDELLIENHAAWELTYRNAEGILDWLTTRRKDAA